MYPTKSSDIFETENSQISRNFDTARFSQHQSVLSRCSVLTSKKNTNRFRSTLRENTGGSLLKDHE